MQERKVAVDSLMAIAKQLHAAHHALADKLMGRQDVPEHYALDTFYQSVKSSSDVQDFILRTAGAAACITHLMHDLETAIHQCMILSNGIVKAQQCLDDVPLQITLCMKQQTLYLYAVPVM